MRTWLVSVILALWLTAQVKATCPAVIKICALVSLTGSEAGNTLNLLDAFDMALSDHSAGAAITGCGTLPFNITYYDDHSNGTYAGLLFDQAVNDSCLFILGGSSSFLAQGEVPEAERLGVPYISPGAALSTIFTTAAWSYSTLSSGYALGAGTMQYLRQMSLFGYLPAIPSLAMLYPSSSYGPDYAAGVNAFLSAHPGAFRTIMNQAYTLGSATEYKAAINTLGTSDPDVFLMPTNTADFAGAQGYYVGSCQKSKIVSYACRGYETSALQTLGSNATGLLISTWYSQAQTDPASRAWMTKWQQYQAVHHPGAPNDANFYGVYGYIAADLMMSAVASTGSLDAATVRTKIGSTTLTGRPVPSGTFTFGGTHQSQTPSVIVQLAADHSNTPLYNPVDGLYYQFSPLSFWSLCVSPQPAAAVRLTSGLLAALLALVAAIYVML